MITMLIVTPTMFLRALQRDDEGIPEYMRGRKIESTGDKRSPLTAASREKY
jgi:hypothetical protein